jgi:hypothetical protein
MVPELVVPIAVPFVQPAADGMKPRPWLPKFEISSRKKNRMTHASVSGHLSSLQVFQPAQKQDRLRLIKNSFNDIAVLINFVWAHYYTWVIKYNSVNRKLFLE